MDNIKASNMENHSSDEKSWMRLWYILKQKSDYLHLKSVRKLRLKLDIEYGY